MTEARQPTHEVSDEGCGVAAMMDPQELRDELDEYVTLQQFPTTSADLVATATGNHAPDEVVDALRHLPAGAAFATPEDVWDALGQK